MRYTAGMNRETALIAIGILVLLSPWSGLPLAWLEWILPVFGVAVVAIGLTFRRKTPAVVHAMPAPAAEEPPAPIAFS